MIIETERLILRPWSEDDAESCYEYARDSRVGPAAGWREHTSVENSREIICSVLAVPDTFAVTLKGQNKAIGSIGLMFGSASNLSLPENEAELGYWIGVPFWGRGYIPEAACELMKYAFEQRNCPVLWSAYFDGNDKSRRVQEKCGFRYIRSDENIYWPLLDCVLTEHVTRITRNQWEKTQQAQNESQRLCEEAQKMRTEAKSMRETAVYMRDEAKKMRGEPKNEKQI